MYGASSLEVNRKDICDLQIKDLFLFKKKRVVQFTFLDTLFQHFHTLSICVIEELKSYHLGPYSN